jgi:hypothetical protein
MLWHDSSANENKQRRFLGTAPWANSLPTLAPQVSFAFDDLDKTFSCKDFAGGS